MFHKLQHIQFQKCRKISTKQIQRMNSQRDNKNKILPEQKLSILKNIKGDIKNLQIKLRKQNKNIPTLNNLLLNNKRIKIQKVNNPKIINDNKQFQRYKLQGISKSLQVRNIVNNKQASDTRLNLIKVSVPLTTRQIKTAQNLNNKPFTVMKTQRVIVAKNRKQFSQMNEQILYEIRQNFLNTKFNIRKDRLSQITKQNKKIHYKINSQKSYYSNSQLNKSYQSNSQISRRLSNSKLSKNSRISIRSNLSNSSSRCSVKQNNKRKVVQNKNKIVLESKNVNQLKNQQIQKLAVLFQDKIYKQNLPLKSIMKPKKVTNNSTKQNNLIQSDYQSLKSLPKLSQIKNNQPKPTLLSKKPQNRTSILSTINENLQQTSNTKFLYRINEQSQTKGNNSYQNSFNKKMIL